VEKHLASKAPLVVAMDDSLLRKTGPHIHGVRYLRDPLSPPFHVNLVRGLRVLQISAALPQGSGMSRMIPIDFQHAVVPKKPSKKATPEELAVYKELLAKTNINVVGQNRLKVLRQDMDNQESSERNLVATVDGRFTNQRFLKNLPERTIIIGRIRKDTVLYHLPEEQPIRGRKRKYGPPAPKPEEFLADDEKYPIQIVRAYAAGKFHDFKIKVLGPLVMRMDSGTHPVRLMVIKPLGYRLKLGGRVLYRQPGFLICTDPSMSIEEMLQDFLWRWDIEVNFRDQKTLLGVGQAQVRTENSNQNAPALAVAGYSMLLLASVRAYGATGVPDRLHQAKWYKREETDRATTNELINQLRREMWATAIRNPHFSDFTTKGSPEQKSEKCPVPAESAILLSLS
jgi:hypothetical protein